MSYIMKLCNQPVSSDTPTIQSIVDKQLRILEETVKADKWTGAKYEIVKRASMTNKGDFGEDVTTDIVNDVLKLAAERVNKGKGPFDIRLLLSTKTIEHKLASEDVSGGFQFNGLRKDNKYDYAFLLGISPEDLWYQMYRKEDLKLTVAMTSGGSDSFKVSKVKRDMIPLTAENLIQTFKDFDLV